MNGWGSAVLGQSDSLPKADKSLVIIKLVTHTKQPIERVIVKMRHSAETVLIQGRTDQNGYAVMGEVKRGTYYIILNCTEYPLFFGTYEVRNFVDTLLLFEEPKRLITNCYSRCYVTPKKIAPCITIGVTPIPPYGTRLPNRVFDNDGNVFLNQYKIGR